MLQSDNRNTLSLDPQNPQSIAQALAQYRLHLDNDSVSRNGQYLLEFVAQTPEGQRPLRLSDLTGAPQQALLRDALILHPDGEEHIPEDPAADNLAYGLSEPLLFALALQYPPLLADILATARAIVAYARRHNDTWALWLDDTGVFGVEALYMLARTDSQYATLLAQYFIPNWDHDHADAYSAFLADLVARHGWQRDIIQAYLWCDSDLQRLRMYEGEWQQGWRHTSLAEHLKSHPEDYRWFKDSLTRRLLSQPKMLESHHQDLEDCNPVLDFFITLQPCGDYLWDDDFDRDAFLGQPFMGGRLEDEAMDLYQAIAAQAHGPLVCYSHRDGQRLADEEARDDPGHDLVLVHQLVASLPTGQALWQYVVDGSQPQQLAKLEALDLFAHSKAKAPAFYRALTDYLPYGDNNSDINNELPFMLGDLEMALLEDGYEGELLPPGSTQERGQQLLRILDILYRLLGVESLTDYQREKLVLDRALISLEDFVGRYSRLDLDADALARQALAVQLSQVDDQHTNDMFNKPLLDSLKDFFGRHRALADPRQWALDAFGPGHYCLMAFLLFEDWQQQRGDQVTQALIGQLSEPALGQQLFDLLMQGTQISDDLKGRGFTLEQHRQLQQFFCEAAPALTFDQALALLRQGLQRKETIRQSSLYFPTFSEHQPCYEALQSLRGRYHYQWLVLAAFWLQQLPLPVGQQAKRFWQALVKLAPVRTLRLVAQMDSTDTYSVEFDEPLAAIDCLDSIEKAGVDQAYRLAFEVQLYFNNRQYRDYLNSLELYAEIDSTATGMFAQVDRNKAKALRQGLDYISEYHKVRFYRHLEVCHPRFTLAGDPALEQDFALSLKRMLTLSILSWEQALLAEQAPQCRLLDGDDLEGKALTLSEQLQIEPRLHQDYGDWLTVLLALDKGDHLEVFGLSEPPKGDRLRGHQVLVFDADLDQAALWQKLNALFDKDARIDAAYQHTLAYLAGDLPYQAIASHYQHRAHRHLEISGPGHFLAGPGDYIWLLDQERRARLAKLLINHSYRGFKLFEGRLADCYLGEQVASGDMDMETYLEQCSDHYIDDHLDDALPGFLAWLDEIGIVAEHQLLFCAKHAEYEGCAAHLALLLPLDLAQQRLAFLNAKHKTALVPLLSQLPQGQQLLALLAADESRQVRDAVAAQRA